MPSRAFGYLQKLGYFRLELCPNPDLENFASAYRSSKRVIDEVDAQSVKNWTGVGQLKAKLH